MWDENKKKWRMEVPQGKQTRESVFQNLSFPQFCTVFWTFGVSVSKKIAIRAMFATLLLDLSRFVPCIMRSKMNWAELSWGQSFSLSNRQVSILSVCLSIWLLLCVQDIHCCKHHKWTILTQYQTILSLKLNESGLKTIQTDRNRIGCFLFQQQLHQGQ